MHRLPGCLKSFYNQPHKALGCLNIYGCLSFPGGLFCVKVATAFKGAEDGLQTRYLGVGLKALVGFTGQKKGRP